MGGKSFFWGDEDRRRFLDVLSFDKNVEGKARVSTINRVHPELDRQTKGYIVNYVENTYSDDSPERLGWLGKL